MIAMLGAGPGWPLPAAGLIGANLPVLNERPLQARPRRAPKALGWELDVAALCLMVTVVLTGFIWRILRKRAAGDSRT